MCFPQIFTGLYRVNYDDKTWELIAYALKNADRQKIHHLNRAKVKVYKLNCYINLYLLQLQL